MDNLAEAYTLHNLKHGTAYKVQISLIFKDSKERILDYWPELKLPNGELNDLDSTYTLFNTAQMPID